jgi:membrane protein
VAFNLLLALIPLLIVTTSAAVFFLGRSGEQSVAEIVDLVDSLIPVTPAREVMLRDLLTDILSSVPTGTATVSIGGITLVWLTTRLFGTLRVVLADVFDIEETRHPVVAKLFDMLISLVSSLFLVSYFGITTYLAIEVRGGTFLSGAEVYLARLLAFLFMLVTFFFLYRYLTRVRVRWRTALVGALFTAVMFEIARFLFAQLGSVINFSSLYSGVIAALVVSVVWSYYVALIFILGGEVAQVYDLLRVRSIQRVVFEQG